MNKAPYKILKAYIEIIGKCNLQCIHCYNSSSNKNKGILDYDFMKKCLDECSLLGISDIVISGGEPLLHKDFTKIVKCATELGISTYVITNGSIMTKEIAKFFKNFVKGVKISLDGHCSDIHDQIRGKESFNKIKKSVELLKNENYEDIEFVTTLMKTNCQHIEEIITYSINAKIKKITFLTLAKQGRANELWDQISLSADEVEKIFIEIYKYRNKYRKEILIEGSPWSNCLLRMLFGGGFFNFNCDIVSFPRIDSHGRVYPCPFFDGNTYLGILFKNSLSKILYNKKSKNYKKAVLERKEKIENCRNCKWKDICGSGCMADAYFFSGTIWDKSAHCKPLSSFYAYLNKEMKLNK